MPEFSVIIPLYNGEKYIEDTLDAVAAQSYKDLEVVICDDGSTDSSANIVKSYSQKHPEITIKYIYQQNKGLGGARNGAMKIAAGRIFSLLDQDDIWYSDKLKNVKQIFDSSPEVSVVCHNEDILKDGNKIGRSSYGPYVPEMFRRLLFKGNCLSTSATSFKREIFEKIGGFSEDVANIHFVEDYDYWLRIAAQDYKFTFIEDALGAYILHEGNYSSNNMDIMCRSEINVIDLNYSRLANKRIFDLFLLRIRKARFYFYNFKLALKSLDALQALRCFMKTCISVLV